MLIISEFCSNATKNYIFLLFVLDIIYIIFKKGDECMKKKIFFNFVLGLGLFFGVSSNIMVNAHSNEEALEQQVIEAAFDVIEQHEVEIEFHNPDVLGQIYHEIYTYDLPEYDSKIIVEYIGEKKTEDFYASYARGTSNIGSQDKTGNGSYSHTAKTTIIGLFPVTLALTTDYTLSSSSITINANNTAGTKGLSHTISTSTETTTKKASSVGATAVAQGNYDVVFSPVNLPVNNNHYVIKNTFKFLGSSGSNGKINISSVFIR